MGAFCIHHDVVISFDYIVHLPFPFSLIIAVVAKQRTNKIMKNEGTRRRNKMKMKMK